MDQPLASSSGPLLSVQDETLATTSSTTPPARPVTGTAVGNGTHAGSDGTPPPASLSFQDQQTLSQLRRGNWAAMEQLVQRYQDRLYATLLRMVNHPEDAADLVQETFVRAMQGVGRFEGKSSLYTWLFRIAVNLAISHRRSNQYRSAVSLDMDREENDGGGSLNRQAAGLRRQLAQETETDPAASAEHRMDCDRLLAALGRIDPDFRAVIVLRDVEECDYDQIAEILDVPVGTIKSRLFRARGALRELLLSPRDARNGTASKAANSAGPNARRET